MNEHGVFRSGLEAEMAAHLTSHSVEYEYEPVRLKYNKPTVYIPDFVLANGIAIEAKGFFTPADRSKHLHVREAYPDLELRFVFTNPRCRIGKHSKTTYGQWCRSNGFLYAEKFVPFEWTTEPVFLQSKQLLRNHTDDDVSES